MRRSTHCKKERTENCWRIDAKFLGRHRYFHRSQSSILEWKNSEGQTVCCIGISSTINNDYPGSAFLTLRYSITNQSTQQTADYDYQIMLNITKCNYGGFRFWLICPLSRDGVPCGRRVRKLYLPPGQRYFGCRHCYNLTYQSQQEHDKSIDPYLKHPELLTLLQGSRRYKDILLGFKAFMALQERAIRQLGAKER